MKQTRTHVVVEALRIELVEPQCHCLIRLRVNKPLARRRDVTVEHRPRPDASGWLCETMSDRCTVFVWLGDLKLAPNVAVRPAPLKPWQALLAVDTAGVVCAKARSRHTVAHAQCHIACTDQAVLNAVNTSDTMRTLKIIFTNKMLMCDQEIRTAKQQEVAKNRVQSELKKRGGMG